MTVLKSLRLFPAFLALVLLCPQVQARHLTPYEEQIVAAALVLEAANQGDIGMRAVLHVLKNRAGSPQRVINVLATPHVLSSLRHVTSQRHPDYGPVIRRAQRDSIAWPKAQRIVRDFQNNNLGPDITFGATHFDISRTLPESWLKRMSVTTVIKDHIFLRYPEPLRGQEPLLCP